MCMYVLVTEKSANCFMESNAKSIKQDPEGTLRNSTSCKQNKNSFNLLDLFQIINQPKKWLEVQS